MDVLHEIITKLDEEQISGESTGLKQTLIYCSSNPSPSEPKGSKVQLEKVQDYLNSDIGGKRSHKSITFRDKTVDRAIIMKKFAYGHFDCVPAVKCLDQGVDIPSVEKAIIMASSGNPKQYIQRRGRVLRQSDVTGKKDAKIYDILVKPPLPEPNSPIRLQDRKLVAKELLRHKKFAEDAKNKDDAIKSIEDVAKMHGIDFKKLSQDWIDKME